MSGWAEFGRVPDLDLTAGEYTITPSETVADTGDAVADLLSGALQEEYHLYDVETSGGDTALEVYRREPDETFVAALSEEGVLGALGRVDVRFQFRPPNGETVMSVERSGPPPTYTLLDGNGEPLATWDRPSVLPWTGAWELRDPAGEPRATAERSGGLGSLVGSSGPETWHVASPDGTELAEFDRGHPDGGIASLALSEVAVTLSGASMPPEIAVAFAVGLLAESQRGSSGSGHATEP